MQGDPQVEDGYTRISNELLDAMCRAGLNARQWAVVMAVARKTYGYGKKTDDISLSQLEKQTGIAKSHASTTVAGLVAAKVLTRVAGTFGFTLSINKRYSQWRLQDQSKGIASGGAKTDLATEGLPNREPLSGVTEMGTGVTDLVTAGGVTDSVMGVTDSGTVTESVMLGLPNREPQKETLQKKENTLSTSVDLASETPPEKPPSDVRRVFDHWRDVMQSPRSQLDAKRVKAIKAALKAGYSVDDLRRAISGCSKTPHNMGKNDRHQKYNGIELILRSADQIDRFIANDGQNPAAADGRQDLGEGRYRQDGRIYGADGRPEVVW
ncbi:hypothetical protein CAL26_23785 [Bordetella genomosp. 9]|uniref:Bacteriophage lambda Replication protein O N-terminal domain-containing protein n=1 Tax=Bordetella genomosp. 9 TaxID=1416803 RepID=A0A261R672_9BORD|nr:replication protein [Bordetella genomosp. 9]OZI20519.1 hypothetical protein CAL26_23785 [Bordetella genomosp. 9]